MSESALERVQAGLEHSIYGIDASGDRLEVMAGLAERVESLEQRCIQLSAMVSKQLDERLHKANRTIEVFESNAIEGKLATLPETYEVLGQRDLLDSKAPLAEYSLAEALRDEPKVRDVVGLGAARVLASQLAEDHERPVTEADIREMHELVLAGHHSAGSYKQWINEIQGSSHVPIPPSDVPDAMNSMTMWLRDCDAPLVWKAATVHAWLTHIHPFDDGNGRIARLLANFVLARGGFPPLIVRSTSDRGRYIDALAHSDEAGDISQLVRVFMTALNRRVIKMENPDYAWKMFEKELQVRQQPLFMRWSAAIDQFLDEVETRLLIDGFRVNRVGSVGVEEFELLRERNASGNTWLAKVGTPGTNGDILIWVGFASANVSRDLHPDQIFPSLYLAERAKGTRPDKPFLPQVRGLPARHDEVSVIVDENRVLFNRGGVVRPLRPSDAAEAYASLLGNHLRSINSP
ncbi:Fic family protein [Aeromicrobium fastidiosum]|nr:Fic family protein [Aeromicrobium fastidiosum]MBP2392160.1 Fic family protein [Aeromicrobium fastidiosum]